MPEKSQKEKIDALYQAVIGLDTNPSDNGLIGDVHDIKNHLRELNGQVRANTMFRKVGTWISGALFMAVVGLLIKLIFGG